MAETIMTYGGSEILYSVFNAVAMLMNNESGTLFRPLSIAVASLGAAWVLIRTFFAPSIESLLGRYFFPFLAVMIIMMVPSQSVRIEDAITGKSYAVKNVPFLLARVSQTISTIGYSITTAFDKVMHTPGDSRYVSSGMLFGANTYVDSHDYLLNSPEMEQNLRRVSKQCIVYDIAFNNYTVEDLKYSNDILGLLEDKTSKVRMLKYCESGKCSTKTCQEAVKNLKEALGKEVKYFQNHNVLKDLPLSFQALTGLQNDARKIIEQQLVINTIRNEYSKLEGFTTARAQLQQRSTYRAMGSLAPYSLVTIRGVFEALLYASFVFVVPMAFLPGGFKFIGNWVWMVAWIHTWPPFFSILNYITQIVAQSQAKSIIAGNEGLSFFTDVGLTGLYADLYALAGFMSASIPYLSYTILQGGIGSFIHLASSMMSPTQSAASAAATEEVTGNYSYANASMGQASYGNHSLLQRQMSPSLSQGFTTFDDGVMKETRSDNISGNDSGIFYNQNRSNLVSSFGLSDSYQQNIQESLNDSLAYNDETRESFSNGINSTARKSAAAVESWSTSLNENNSLREGMSLSDQKSVNESKQAADHYSSTHGCTVKEAGNLLANASIGYKLFGSEVSAQVGQGVSAEQAEAISWMDQHGYSNAVAKVNQMVTNREKMQGFSEVDDNTARINEDRSYSYDELKSYQDQHSQSLQRTNALQSLHSYNTSNSVSFQEDLTNDWVGYLGDKVGENQARQLILNPSKSEDLVKYREDFLQMHQSKEVEKLIGSDVVGQDISSRYEQNAVKRIDDNDYETNKSAEIRDFSQSRNIQMKAPNSSIILKNLETHKKDFDKGFNSLDAKINSDTDREKKKFNEEKERNLLIKAGSKGVQSIGSSGRKIGSTVKGWFSAP